MGETVAKKLALALHSIDRIIEATTEDLIRIGDIGVRIAQSVVAYFSDEDNLRFVERLRQYGVQIKLPKSDFRREPTSYPVRQSLSVARLPIIPVMNIKLLSNSTEV